MWNGRDTRYNCNSVATTAAAVTAYAACVALRPQLVVSAGTCGGFSSMGGSIGDLYVSSKCVFHARRIPAQHAPDGSSAGLEEYGFGHFRSAPLPR